MSVVWNGVVISSEEANRRMTELRKKGMWWTDEKETESDPLYEGNKLQPIGG